MEELLKSLPQALQYVVLALVGLGLAGRLIQNVVKGWREASESDAAHADVGRGKIVAVSTATLADMRPMEEAAKKLGVAAETLGSLSVNLAGLLPLVPMLKEVAEDLARLLSIIEKQARQAEIDREIRLDRERREH